MSTSNYADLETGKRPPEARATDLPNAMRVRAGVGYTSVAVTYRQLFAIKFNARERLMDALHEHAVACVIERGDINANKHFNKRYTRVRFEQDGVHVLLIDDDPVLAVEPNW